MMATMASLAPLARCTMPGCPWRWRDGPDRPCSEHDDSRAVRHAAEQLGIDLAIDQAPGDRGGSGDGGRRPSGDHPPGQ